MGSHLNYSNRQNAPEEDQLCKLPKHNLDQHARFTLIKQLDNVNIDSYLTTLHLKKSKDSWIQKLKTLYLYGLNAKLNFRTQW